MDNYNDITFLERQQEKLKDKVMILLKQQQEKLKDNITTSEKWLCTEGLTASQSKVQEVRRHLESLNIAVAESEAAIEEMRSRSSQ